MLTIYIEEKYELQSATNIPSKIEKRYCIIINILIN